MKVKAQSVVSGQYQYLDIITALFVAILIISNIASTKIFSFGSVTLDAGILLFPLIYIFGDVLTEVYGYARGRRVIWIGFLCNVLMAAIFVLLEKPTPISASMPQRISNERSWSR